MAEEQRYTVIDGSSGVPCNRKRNHGIHKVTKGEMGAARLGEDPIHQHHVNVSTEKTSTFTRESPKTRAAETTIASPPPSVVGKVVKNFEKLRLAEDATARGALESRVDLLRS